MSSRAIPFTIMAVLVLAFLVIDYFTAVQYAKDDDFRKAFGLYNACSNTQVIIRNDLYCTDAFISTSLRDGNTTSYTYFPAKTYRHIDLPRLLPMELLDKFALCVMNPAAGVENGKFDFDDDGWVCTDTNLSILWSGLWSDNY